MALYEYEYEYKGMSYNIVDLFEVHEKLKNDDAFFETYLQSNLNCLEVTGTQDTENFKHISSDTLDSTEDRNKQQWSEKSTKLFLSLYKERKDKFRDPKIKKKNVWTEIVKEMYANGYKNFTEDMLDRKFRNLKRSFKIIKDNNAKKSTGRGRVTWEFYDIFDEIFDEDRTINFGPTISSLNGGLATTQYLSPATSTSVSSNIVSAAQSSRTLIDSPSLTINTSKPSASSSYLSSSRTPSPALPSAIATHAFSEPYPQNSSYNVNANQRRKKRTQKETYDQRKRLLAIEAERLKMIAELKKSIDKNNIIQQERNELLKKLIAKM